MTFFQTDLSDCERGAGKGGSIPNVGLFEYQIQFDLKPVT